MPRAHLTDRLVRSLKADRETEYWDLAKDQLVLRVLPSGTKTWLVRYYAQSHPGRRARYRRKKIGRYPQLSLAKAREKARVVLGEVAAGSDPGGWRERAASSWSFERLADEFLRRHSIPKKVTWREDQRIIEKDLLPFLGGFPAESIKKRDVLSVLDSIVDRGSPIMANRTRVLLSRIYTFGISRDVVEHNPVLGTEPPGREGRRDRVLGLSEVRTLWIGLHREDPIVAAGFRLLLLTGQRTKSILGMASNQIDGEWWTIPSDLFKSRRPHRVFLSSLTRAVIAEAAKIGSSEELVLSSSRTGTEMNPTVFSRAARRIYPVLETAPFTPHDLRRTVASQLAEAGTYRFVIERVLGHSDSSVTGRYDLYGYSREKQEALQTWSDVVESCVRQRSLRPVAGHEQ